MKMTQFLVMAAATVAWALGAGALAAEQGAGNGDGLQSPVAAARVRAVESLARVCDGAGSAKLIAALRDTDAGVRCAAARGLGQNRVAAAVPALIEAVGDGDFNVRFYAASALGDIKDASAVPALTRAMNDPEWCVRDQAAWALREIRVALGQEKPYVRRPDPAAVAPAAEGANPAESGLAAYWSFDDRDSKVAKDVSGHGNHGVIKGCTVVDGKMGAGLKFSHGAYVELGRPAALPIQDCAMTVMAWAKPEAKAGVVVARGGAFCGYSLYIKDGLAKFGIHRVKDGPSYIAASATPVELGQWVHLAGVVRKERIEVFVNGKLAGSAKTNGYIPSNCGQGMEIGYDEGSTAAEIRDAFEGIIDEVKCFAEALDEARIQSESASHQEKKQ